MSTFRLDRLFAPRSVALIGASTRDHSVGRTILRNLKSAGFTGSIRLVNPHYSEIEGIAAIKSVADLPETGEGIGALEGEVLAENATMLRMCAELGFTIAASPSDASIRAVMLALDHS